MHNFVPYASQKSVSQRKPSNRTLLQVAASSFLLFVILEIVGALRSNSLSLLGDAIAMSVDVFTYSTNLYAEGTKGNADSRSIVNRVMNEIGIPSFSVICLLAVTIYITVDAIQVLQNPPDVNDVPVSYLYGFSLLNLVIDCICGAYFYSRGKEVFFEPIIPLHLISLEVSLDSEEEEREFGHLDEDLDLTLKSNNDPYSSDNSRNSYGGANNYSEGGQKKNLNMLSAFTHIGGDTVRTISVIGAACISSIFEIDADVCDAWAAVVVAVTIVLITLPLIIDIVEAVKNISAESSGGRGFGMRYSPVPIFSRDGDRDIDNIGKDVIF